jgi:hypothetical protein
MSALVLVVFHVFVSSFALYNGSYRHAVWCGAVQTVFGCYLLLLHEYGGNKIATDPKRSNKMHASSNIFLTQSWIGSGEVLHQTSIIRARHHNVLLLHYIRVGCVGFTEVLDLCQIQ